jgi:lipopolysaccharide export system permease protein
MALIEEGVYMREFPGYVLYVGRKKGNVIEDVTLYSLDDKGQTTSSIRARRGIVTARPENRTLLLDLYDVRGDLRDADDPTNVRKIRAGTTAQRYPIELDLGKVLRQARSARKIGDYTLAELLDEDQRLRGQGIYPAAVLLEAHQRVAGAVTCVAFTLVGIPLGLRTGRRETSIGIALSLGLALLYYVLIMVANTLKDRPQLYPEAILWAPNILFQAAGVWLLWRVSRR